MCFLLQNRWAKFVTSPDSVQDPTVGGISESRHLIAALLAGDACILPPFQSYSSLNSENPDSDNKILHSQSKHQELAANSVTTDC